MNKILNLIAITIFVTIGFSACTKKENPKPEPRVSMKHISVTGQNKLFTVIITFSEAVYKNADKTGALDNSSFKVKISGGIAKLASYNVTHIAGSITASIDIKTSENADGTEIISIAPASATSIYNAEGTPMESSQSLEANLSGTAHKTITIKDDGNGIGTQTWTANNTYLLDGFCFVNNGQKLTIEAGTIIKGKPGQGENASALIIARGGKIDAQGTAEKPIIFTAEADNLDGTGVGEFDDGLWGGVILLGKSRLNTVPAEQQIEGIPQTEPRGLYGGNDDNDNSGILKYISIRHGGSDIGAGNEINGLTLGGVGSGTVIDYIEVFANKDDAIEFFGGTPNVKHFVAAFCGDDSFDYDQGYRGKGQFWLAVQGFDRGDRIGEHDGGTDPETGQPFAIPTIYNVTYIGQGAGAGKRTVTFRDNAGGNYANSIFFNQEKGVDVELLATECSYTRFQNGDLTLKNNVFFKIGSNPVLFAKAYDVSSSVESQVDSILANYFTSAGNIVADAGLSAGNKFGIVPSQNYTGNMAEYPSDSFFDHVNYKGAIDPANNWVKGWTLFSKYLIK